MRFPSTFSVAPLYSGFVLNNVAFAGNAKTWDALIDPATGVEIRYWIDGNKAFLSDYQERLNELLLSASAAHNPPDNGIHRILDVLVLWLPVIACVLISVIILILIRHILKRHKWRFDHKIHERDNIKSVQLPGVQWNDGNTRKHINTLKQIGQDHVYIVNYKDGRKTVQTVKRHSALDKLYYEYLQKTNQFDE